MPKEKNTQWHPAFTAAIHLEFSENKQDLEFHSEVTLNTMPLRIDMILLKKKWNSIIKNEIGKIFSIHNLVEYKSPKDELNLDVFLKGIAYAYLYKSYEGHIDDILLSDVTLSFIREHPPIKLFKILKDMDFAVEEFSSGIYYINRYSEIKIQIIVTKELNKEEHVWINSLTNQIEEEHARKLVEITSGLIDCDDINYADSVWEVVATENASLISQLREDEEMCNALAKIMKPEIDEAFDNGQLVQLFNLLKKNIISKDEAVQETELSAAEFQKRYEEYLEHNQ